jgi:nucleoside-diphosphate-sugar epimerase
MFCTRDSAEKRTYYIHNSDPVVLSQNNKPTIALTGATGFLGSHLMASLLSDGYRIIVLGRPAREGTLKERISRLLRWFGIAGLTGQIDFVEIDLLKPLLGVPEAKYKELCAITEQIIHCASDTSFAERNRDIVFNSNVYSLESILEFAADARVKFFNYISTAYVAGVNEAVSMECFSTATEFLNVYEESKARAENIIGTFCKKKEVPFTIIRPSIVYGDSRTGRSLKFNALYFPLQSLKCVVDIYLNDIKNHEGRKSKQHGIYIDEEGFLFLPLRIYLPKEGALNLIPVDYFVSATMKIITRVTSDGIFHLTNNTPAKLELISKYNEKLLKVKGVEILYGRSAENVLRNPAEELFDRFIAPYRSYLSDSRVFDRTNTDFVTDQLLPPEFTYEIFRNCMEYAIRVNWGESVFEEETKKTQQSG